MTATNSTNQGTKSSDASSALNSVTQSQEELEAAVSRSECGTTKQHSSKQTHNQTNTTTNLSFQHDTITTRRITQLSYLLPIAKGIAFPFVKVSFIAMAEKLLRAAIKEGIDPQLATRIEEDIFDQYANPITDAFLMRSLGFYGTVVVAASLVAVVSIVLPLSKALSKDYLNHMEVKRLQEILYERFILEPNSVAIDEASDLLYTKINAVQKYWEHTKYSKLDDLSSMITGLLLILILAWDLGLACLAGTVVCVILSKYIWNKLSTPWAQQREEKMVQSNSQLIDLVVCKEVVLTHAQEVQEQTHLHELLQADEMDIKKLFQANFISESIKTATFTMFIPTLFLFVYKFDRTMDRVFQLLILIVILDEIMRAFLAYTKHAEVEAEYARAKDSFCHVLGMKEAVLFPPDFNWSLKPDVKRLGIDDKVEIMGHSETYNVDKDEELGGPMKSEQFDVVMAARSSRRLSLRQSTRDLSEMISQAFEEGQCAGELCIKDASFGYKMKDGTKKTVVNKMNMTLKIGEHYAIMGETGVGKSTLLKALSGLQEPLEGDIFFDGNAVDTTSIHWREQVAVVSQHSVFLNRSVRENLCYGLATNKSDEEILVALDKVKMKEHVLALPQGIDTIVEGNGSTFSGGQQQRLQIARLLLSSCPLVLLDECTSALDPTTTQEVLQVLREFLVGKTMIMITHDVDTLVLAQHVLEMKPEGMVEQAQEKRIATIYAGLTQRRPSEILSEFKRGIEKRGLANQ